MIESLKSPERLGHRRPKEPLIRAELRSSLSSRIRRSQDERGFISYEISDRLEINCKSLHACICQIVKQSPSKTLLDKKLSRFTMVRF